jgi:hypothetical protein
MLETLDKELAYYKKPRTNLDGKNIPVIDIDEDVYKVFLNLRTPFVFDYEGASIHSKYKGKYPIEYINARQVRKAIADGHDGVIYMNISDPYLANSYGVFSPNQIKSATGNSGQFSLSDQTIYDSDPTPVYQTTPSKQSKLIELVRQANEKGVKGIHIVSQSDLVNEDIYIRSAKGFVRNGEIYINVDRA